jgi:hypothetical protein
MESPYAGYAPFSYQENSKRQCLVAEGARRPSDANPYATRTRLIEQGADALYGSEHIQHPL